MTTAAIAQRLARLGVRDAADSYREEVRLRLRAGGTERAEAVRQADADMWTIWEPIVKGLEATQAEGQTPRLAGLPAEIDSALDPGYREADAGRRLRDGWLWVVEEWMRVIADTDDGPVANIPAASKAPPNAFALLVLSTYALSSPDKRRELIARALAFAVKATEVTPEGTDDNTDDGKGFMDGVA